jgi:hypothetical protein
MQQHVTILGALYIAFSVYGVLAAVIIFLVLTGGGLISGDSQAIAITSFIGAAISFFLIIISVPGIIGGIGLLKRKEWARILVLVLGCINLINIPFGTILGIYTIWMLTKPEMAQLFQQGTAVPPANG